MKAILTDIEGTTSSISYVKDVMFKYSQDKLRDFLFKNFEKKEIKNILDRLYKSIDKNADLEKAINIFSDLIEKDIKDPLLKELQGHIWEEGFLSGELKGHIYEDAYRILKDLKENGFKIYVYSSGSIKAQKLFFSHTDYGNITYLFDEFFDTSIGSKKDSKSYMNISKITNIHPDEFLFLSDVEDELKAAKEAGMNAILVSRYNNLSNFYKSIKTFDEILS